MGGGSVGGDGSQGLRSDAEGLEGSAPDRRGERPRRKSGEHGEGDVRRRDVEGDDTEAKSRASRLLGLQSCEVSLQSRPRTRSDHSLPRQDNLPEITIMTMLTWNNCSRRYS